MEYIVNIIRFPDYGLKRFASIFITGAQHLKDHVVPHARNNYHPHVLGSRSLALLSIGLVSLKIFTIALVSWGPVESAYSSAITTENIISLTNQSRKSFNLTNLTENSVLNIAAQAKADSMLAEGYFAHNSPDGRTPWSFIGAAGYSYIMAGENLAVNFNEAENVEDAWMNSPGHKANILNKNFEEIGIGISQGEYQGHSAIFVVQMFGVPAAQKIQLAEKPTVVQKEAVPVPSVKAILVAESASAVSGATDEQLSKQAHAVLEIADSQLSVYDENVNIETTVTGSPVKVVATFGQSAVMLEAKENNLWVGKVSLKSLAEGSLTVRVKATNIKGSSVEKQLADFSNATVNNYHVTSLDQPVTNVSFMGKVFDPKMFEQKFYLLFIAGLLSSLVLAIGIKRHIQHLNLIANTSLVAVFATLLWVTG